MVPPGLPPRITEWVRPRFAVGVVIAAAVGVGLFLILGRPRPSTDAAQWRGETRTRVNALPAAGAAQEPVDIGVLHDIDTLVNPIARHEQAAAQLDNYRVSMEKAAEQRRVEEESVEATLAFLMANPLSGTFPELSDTDSPGAYVKSLNRDPRVAKLLRIAAEGPEQQQDVLRNALLEHCRAFVEKYPLSTTEGEAWQPSVMGPGGTKVFPYILAQLDGQGETLPLLLAMFERGQEASRTHVAALITAGKLAGTPQLVQGKIVHSDLTRIIALGCQDVLDRLARNPGRVTPEQAAALADYSAWQDTREPEEVYAGKDYERAILFAARFCGRALTLRGYSYAG